MADDLHARFLAQGFTAVETHISRVYLRDGDVYKLKRPVNLGFLDFTTLTLREQACLAEVTLNRRLARDVYLGVEGVVLGAAGELTFVPHELAQGREVIEWAVHMRRLRDEDRADLLLARGALTPRDLEMVAAHLASFHASARADAYTASFGTPEVIGRNVEENFAQVEGSIGRYLSRAEQDALRTFQRTFLTEQRELFMRRVAEGRVRDGHGDLRLEHVYRTREHGYVMLDCIEFNERFRFADVCADLSFLAMDLSFHDRVDLAETFVAAYARESGDYELYRLLDFYESYRAFVRAKISSILADDPHVKAEVRTRAEHEARRYYLLALSASQKPLAPARILVFMGPIAAGKSTLAEATARELSAPLLSADRTRKELLGVEATASLKAQAFQGAYTPHMTERVYETLRTRAEHVLMSGRTVVLDATFRAQAERDALRTVARRLGVDVLFVECQCPREVMRARLSAREKGPSVSDARLELLEPFLASYEACDELVPEEHLVVDTSQPVEVSLEFVRARLG